MSVLSQRSSVEIDSPRGHPEDAGPAGQPASVAVGKTHTVAC
jgi:hypothetical protein